RRATSVLLERRGPVQRYECKHNGGTPRALQALKQVHTKDSSSLRESLAVTETHWPIAAPQKGFIPQRIYSARSTKRFLADSTPTGRIKPARSGASGQTSKSP